MKNEKNNMKSPILIGGSLLALAQAATAATLINSAGITATADVLNSGPAFPTSNMLDGEVLEGWQDGTPAHTNVANPFFLGVDRPAQHQNNHWISDDLTPDINGDFNAVLTFDLGAAYNLEEIRVLNTSNTAWNDRETDEFTIAVSTDNGANYTPSGGTISLQDYTLGFQTIPLLETGVTNVQLSIKNVASINNHDGPFAPVFAADRAVGLSEIEFYQVPEPSSALLSGLGFAFLLRRKRRA